MPMFCPDCGSILRPKEKAGKKILFCSCGFSKNPEEGETAGDNNQMLMWLLGIAVLGVVLAYFSKSGGSKMTKPKGE